MSGEIQLEEIGFENPTDMHDHENSGGITAPSLSEMSNEEGVKAGTKPTCRICLETHVEKDDDIISPCMCKGTQQFVHRSCLNHWREMKKGFSFSHCTTCKAQFHLKVVKQNGIYWSKIKFMLFLARDVLLLFLISQMVITLIGCRAYAIYKSGSFKTSFSANWDRILWTHHLSFFYLIGVVFFFALLGFFGLIFHCIASKNLTGFIYLCVVWGILFFIPPSLKGNAIMAVVLVVKCVILGFAYGFLTTKMVIQWIWQRHYHILAKKELTNEYVVEDLHGSYTPPELAPEILFA